MSFIGMDTSSRVLRTDENRLARRPMFPGAFHISFDGPPFGTSSEREFLDL